jgi:MFS family permease
LSAVERYARVLRAPHVARLWAVTTLARMPIAINGLAIVLAMREETGSFAAAGVASGAHVLVVGLSNPVLGRFIDRLGPRKAVPPMIAWHVATMAAFVALLPTAPEELLVALAALAGLGQPSWSAMLRAMWPRLLGGEAMITTAFALDATLTEMIFVIGPLLVAVAVAIAEPQLALVAGLVLVTVGAALFVAQPAVRDWEAEDHGQRGWLGALASPGLLTVFLATIPIGLAFGAFEIALPAFADEHGAAGDAGILIALWAVGSALGGLAYGAREWVRPMPYRWIVLSAGLWPLLLAPVLSDSMVVMGLLVVPAGACIAPALATGAQLMGTLAPPGMSTEAYAWGTTAIVVGFAAGSAIGGALVEAADWQAPVLLATGSAAAGAAIAYTRRATLHLRPATA